VCYIHSELPNASFTVKSMSYRSLILIVVASYGLHAARVQAQSDSTMIERKPQVMVMRDTLEPLGILPQLGFSTLGFLVGYLPDGYANVKTEMEGQGQAGFLSPVITPFLTSLGADFARTHFWKNNDDKGSYWAGVLGGFLGEVAGALIIVAMNHDGFHQTYATVLLSYLIPTVTLSTLFYNVF
jgi:hypothetical protein